MAETPHRIQRIVLAMDGSPHSNAGARWAAAMAGGMGASIVAVYVIENPVDFSMGVMPFVPPSLDPEWRDAMLVAFEKEWCEPLAAAQVAYSTRMEDGRAATEIVRVADEVEADVVVMGRRGRGGISELLLGSVSHEVAQHCKRPVLLISTSDHGQGEHRDSS